MTDGPHLSAAGGGCGWGRVRGPRWAVGLAGQRSWCWAVAAAGPKRGKRRRGLKGRVFIFQTHSDNDFKLEFEFKHNKMMQQHVCNSELLYFIIEL
jgi:hypothetical protein